MAEEENPYQSCPSDEDEFEYTCDEEKFSEFFKRKISIDTKNKEKVIPDLTFDGLLKHWKEKGFKNVITMVGAGISTSAGIPDFRSPGSGIYHNLEKFDLPDPLFVFDYRYFIHDPKPFYTLAKDLYPGSFYPTPTHYFCRLLHEKGLLLRHYTQNIDTLERIAGIPSEKLVEAHGTFYSNHCMECKENYTIEWMKEQIFADVIPTCNKCNSVVRPDIVFFNENLPDDFYHLPIKDFLKCDLLIIMGTSLKVNPFASLVDNASPRCVRLLINKTKVGHKVDHLDAWFMLSSGLNFDDEKNNIRDVAYIGNCDDGVMALADGLGWGDELREMVKTEHERLKVEQSKAAKVEVKTKAKVDEDNSKVKTNDKEEDTPKEEAAETKS